MQGSESNHPITEWMKAIWKQTTNHRCTACHDGLLNKVYKYEQAPHSIAFIVSVTSALIEAQIILSECNQMYRLCSIIYYHNFHFVCRFIEPNGEIWYHNGYADQYKVHYYNNITNIDMKGLQTAGDYKASMLIYTAM